MELGAETAATGNTIGDPSVLLVDGTGGLFSCKGGDGKGAALLGVLPLLRFEVFFGIFARRGFLSSSHFNRMPYPSQAMFSLTQLLQWGFASSHLYPRRLHVQQPNQWS